MKIINCNMCGTRLKVGKNELQNYYKIKIKTPYIDVVDIHAHCCDDCFSNLVKILLKGDKK